MYPLRLALVLLAAAATAANADPPVRFVDSDRSAGTSAAVVVDPDAALAHTAIMQPVNNDGEIVSTGDAAGQADRVLSNINWALAAAGSGRESAVKLNVYAADHESLEMARNRVAEAFPGPTRPAATFVVNEQPHEEVLVTMDAVATAPLAEPDRVARFVSDQLPAPHGGAHVAVMPPGEVFYIAGQVQEGDTLDAAVRETMDALHRTIDHFGLGPEHVVQVKAFIQPMDGADDTAREIAAMYDLDPAPPAVVTEWQASIPRPTEIELIAVTPEPQLTEAEGQPARYLTPPWMSASEVFSRVAAARSDAHNGWVYFSGITADGEREPEDQVHEAFDILQQRCDQTGSDLQHLIKATYYVTDRAITRALGAVRPEYYDPQRPPSASLVISRGVGNPQGMYTLDMIGVKK